MPSTRLVLPAGRRRTTRMARAIRAAYRDTMALWSEFRTPILAFLLVTIGGGLLYGELWALSGRTRVATIELPYLILQMMILQLSADSMPQEWYLAAFWYVMPIVAIFIVGRGATDFVRLFFDRSERRSAWEEAVISTYSNHVIILGVGHVGLRVARTLAGMGFDVVAIDAKIKPHIEEELSKMGIPIITGDGRTPGILDKAELREAMAFVACTSSDQTNLEVIMRARDMNPDVRIVARMWDDQYAKQMKQFMGVQAVLSASDLAAPVFAGAAVGVEITQTLHINGVDYSMIRLKVETGSFLDGGTVGQLQDDNDMDIVLHGRGSNVDVQPPNDMRVQSDDTLVIFARHDQVINLVERNRRGSRKN